MSPKSSENQAASSAQSGEKAARSLASFFIATYEGVRRDPKAAATFVLLLWLGAHEAWSEIREFVPPAPPAATAPTAAGAPLTEERVEMIADRAADRAATRVSEQLSKRIDDLIFLSAARRNGSVAAAIPRPEP